MKKFSFKLETILKHRKILEENERNKLSRIQYELQKELDHLRELQARQRETLLELAMNRHTCEQHEVAWFCLFIDRLGLEIERSSNRIVQLEKERQSQMRLVIEASRSKKILDTLKTKKQKEFVGMQQKQEQKAVDEIVVSRFAQKDR